LLDINVNGENVGRLAELLHGQDVPIVFLSGYSDPELLSPALRALPRMQKPADAAEVVGKIGAVVRASRRPPASRRVGR
jgi:DNA-binding LytR/AlgR family response regulator